MKLAFWRKAQPSQTKKTSYRLWYGHRLLCETSDYERLVRTRERFERDYPAARNQTYSTNGLGGEYFNV